MGERTERDQLLSGRAIISERPRVGNQWRIVVSVLASLLLSASSLTAVQTTQPVKTPHKKSKSSSSSASARSSKYHSRHAKWAPMFPGSHDKLVEQNAELDRSQVPRMNNEFELVQ